MPAQTGPGQTPPGQTPPGQTPPGQTPPGQPGQPGQQQGPGRSQGQDQGEKVRSMIKNAASSFAHGASMARQLMAESTQDASRDLIGRSQRMRKEVDGAVSAQMMEAQGMINQLVQLLGMARTR